MNFDDIKLDLESGAAFNFPEQWAKPDEEPDIKPAPRPGSGGSSCLSVCYPC